MRTLRKNKQKLKYSLYKGRTLDYERDKKGNIVYGEDGKPILSGNNINFYDLPVDFLGNISFASGEVVAEAYGLSTSDYDSKIVMAKGAIPIDETSLIFYESEPVIVGDRVDPNSADFRVIKVQPSLGYVVYLLRRINK